MIDDSRKRIDKSLIDVNGIGSFSKTLWEDLLLQLFNGLLATLVSPLLATYLFIDSALHFYMIFWTHFVLRNKIDLNKVLDLESIIQSKINDKYRLEVNKH